MSRFLAAFRAKIDHFMKLAMSFEADALTFQPCSHWSRTVLPEQDRNLKIIRYSEIASFQIIIVKISKRPEASIRFARDRFAEVFLLDDNRLQHRVDFQCHAKVTLRNSLCRSELAVWYFAQYHYQRIHVPQLAR